MTTTCTHPTHCIAPSPHATLVLPTFSVWRALARLGAGFRAVLHAWHIRRKDADALDQLNAHQLRDIGAPCWLQRRAASRQAMDAYEQFKAMSRLKY